MVDLTTPEVVIEVLDAAYNCGDVSTILQHYETEALLVPEPGREVRGLDAIEMFYRRFMQPGLSATQERTHVLTADGICLFTSRWVLRTPDGDARRFVSTVVLRAQSDGSWKVLIDNARGPEVL